MPPPLYILLSVAGLLLLIATCNVASLLIARAAARQREIGVRMAIDAGRRRIVAQLLTECFLLSVIAVALALWMATTLGGALVALASRSNESSPISLRLDWRVFSFAILVAIGTTLLFGLVPAWKACRVQVNPMLKSASNGHGHKRLAGGSLVAAQVAISVLLLTGAALLIRTLHNMRSFDPGFRRDHVLLVGFYWDDSEAGLSRLQRLAQPLGDRLANLSGVRSLAVCTYAGLLGSTHTERITLPGQRTTAAEREEVRLNHVSAGYFQAFGMRLVAGRRIEAHDTSSSTKVAVVNEALAKRYFPGESPLGKLISFGTSFHPEKAGRDRRHRGRRQISKPARTSLSACFSAAEPEERRPAECHDTYSRRSTCAGWPGAQPRAGVGQTCGTGHHHNTLEENIEGTLTNTPRTMFPRWESGFS